MLGLRFGSSAYSLSYLIIQNKYYPTCISKNEGFLSSPKYFLSQYFASLIFSSLNRRLLITWDVNQNITLFAPPTLFFCLLLGLLLPAAGPRQHPPHLPGRDLETGPRGSLSLSSLTMFSRDMFVHRHGIADNLSYM